MLYVNYCIIKRNDLCVCGSGKKYKICCIKKYTAIAEIVRGMYNPGQVNYAIQGVYAIEDSILEYSGPEAR